MPHKKHRIKGTKTIFKLRGQKPQRYAFGAIVLHKGKKMRQRFGFKGRKKLIELSLVPIRK